MQNPNDAFSVTREEGAAESTGRGRHEAEEERAVSKEVAQERGGRRTEMRSETEEEAVNEG